MTRAHNASTYNDDFFAWTRQQAAALRRIPRDALSKAIDIEHVAEEIEDLGKRDLRDVTSFLARLLEHMMKVVCAPEADSVSHWRGEALNFQLSARDAFSPSMRQLLEIDAIWKRADKLARVSGVGFGVSSPYPFELDDLLKDDFDLDSALAHLAAAMRSPLSTRT